MFLLVGAGWTTLHCGGGPESPKSCNSPSGFLLRALFGIFVQSSKTAEPRIFADRLEKTAEPQIFTGQKRITTDFTNGNRNSNTTHSRPMNPVHPVRIRVNPQFNPRKSVAKPFLKYEKPITRSR